jgi:transposase
MEDWVTIKNLKAKNPDISNREIARQLGISHNTVKLALERKSSPEYKREEKTNSSLDPFRDVISKMANVTKLKGSRILKEIRSKGYTGGQTAFYDFLSKIKHPQTKHYTPYETSPGEQAQFDRRVLILCLSEVISPLYISTATFTPLAATRSLRYPYLKTRHQYLKHLKTAS